MIRNIIFIMAESKSNCGAMAGTFAIGAVTGGFLFLGIAVLAGRCCMGNCTPQNRCVTCRTNKTSYISRGVGGACLGGALALLFR